MNIFSFLIFLLVKTETITVFIHHALTVHKHIYVPFLSINLTCMTALYYCKYEVPDHKVGIYCNVIGPLAALRRMHFRAKRF